MKHEENYLLKDAASLLGVAPYRITYLLTSRQIPEPQRIGGRRLFLPDDLRRLADKLGVDLDLPTEGRADV